MNLLRPEFRRNVKAEWRGILALACLAVASVAVEALLPWPLKLIVDNVIGEAALPRPFDVVHALPGGATASALLGWLTLAVVLLFLMSQGIGLIKAVVQGNVSGRIKYALARDVLVRLQSLSLAYHRRERKGDLLHRISADSECLPSLLLGAGLPALTAVVSLVVFFAIMWRLDSLLASVAVLVALPMGAFMRVLGPRMSERAYEQQQKEGEIWTVAEQTLTALPVVQAFGREAHEGARFRRVADHTIQAYVRTTVTELQFKIGVDGCQALGIALIMLLGGLRVHQGALTLGSLLVFLSYLVALYAPLNTLAYLSSTLAYARASYRRLADVLDASDEVSDPQNPQSIPVKSEGRRGRVTLRNVVFGYSRDVPVLRGVSVDIAPGEHVALVGPTGGGKSTLVALIPRLFDAWEGSVLLDGCDVKRLRLAEVRAQVSFVLQDPCLLPLSVAENIGYGAPDASREEVIRAAVIARADDFIRRMPQGYDTVIGEKGMTLSGGQRQRLAIARAVLKDSPILVMDEPTSALDVETEHALLEALRELMADRTTITIAHRLSTIRRADRVLVLKEGRLTETSSREAWRAGAELYVNDDVRKLSGN